MDEWLAPPTAELELPELKLDLDLDLDLDLLLPSSPPLFSPALSGRSSISDYNDLLSSSHTSPDPFVDFSSASSSSSASSCDGEIPATHVHDVDGDGDLPMSASVSPEQELFSAPLPFHHPHDPVLFQHEAYTPLMPALYSHAPSYSLGRVPQLPPPSPPLPNNNYLSCITPQTFVAEASSSSDESLDSKEVDFDIGSPLSSLSSDEDDEMDDEEEDEDEDDAEDNSSSYSSARPTSRPSAIRRTTAKPALDNRPKPLPLQQPPLPSATPTVRPKFNPTLPLDPETALALSRRLTALSSPSLPFNPSRKGVPPPKSRTAPTSQLDRRKSAKRPLELHTTCRTCGDEVAKLVLRGSNGSSLENFAPKATFNCTLCVPVVGDDSRFGAVDDGPGYESTISAAVDALQGLAIDPSLSEPRLPTLAEVMPSLKDECLACDVCSYVVATGAVAAIKGVSPSFTIETICPRCSDRYAPCTDCGGGGGRLTAGRWRCQELFPNRKTCQLSHLRNPPLSERTFDVQQITELTKKNADALALSCRQVYFNTRLGALARPEMLERGDGLVRTYDHCFSSTIDEWNLLSPLIHDDIEESDGIRRFISTQTSAPHKRRASAKASATDDLAEDDVLAGFALIEHDLVRGGVFFATMVPWATSGHAFDANTFLADESLRQIEDALVITNQKRKAAKLPLYPRIEYTWLVTPFRADSKLTQSTSRRGYVLLDEYLNQYPGTDREEFPPYRDIFLPHQYMSGWTVWVRPVAAAPGVLSSKVSRRRKV